MTALKSGQAGETSAAPHVPSGWDDLLLLDDQLTEEERLVRDTARGYAQDKLMPRVMSAYRDERFDRDIMEEMGTLGLLGPTIPGNLWRGGARLCLLWPRRPGDRAGRFRLSLGDERAVIAGDVSDPRLWQRGAAPEISL